MVDFYITEEDSIQQLEPWNETKGIKRKLELSEPIVKIPRLSKDNYSHSKETLMAYKRIWDNLDTTKPIDAKLESFLWNKIREYNQILSKEGTNSNIQK